MKANVGENEDESGRADVCLLEGGGVDGRAAHEIMLRGGSHLEEVSHEGHFSAGECGVAVENLEEFIGEGGVVANDDVIGGLHLGGAEPMTVRQAVQRFGGQRDEVGVAVKPNEDGHGEEGTPHRGSRGDIAEADRRRADEPPPQRVVVGFDAGVDAVLVVPKQPRGSDPRDQERY